LTHYMTKTVIMKWIEEQNSCLTRKEIYPINAENDFTLEDLLDSVKSELKSEYDMTMKKEDQWKLCNDMIGRILTYLDEDEVRRSTKKAVKSEIWDFFNKIDDEDEDVYENEQRFNR